MTVPAARELVARFFAEPPPLVPADLGLLVRVAGEAYFVPASRIVEVVPPLPMTPLPDSTASAIAFWRGSAYPVVGDADRPLLLLLLRSPAGQFLLATGGPPEAISRERLPEGVPDFAETA